ncbi:MAG: DUF721 domain-containing protein [Candidatus Zixiibacteriota bacterium]
MHHRKGTKPTPIAPLIAGVVKSLGVERSYSGWSAVSLWPEIVGDQISRISRAYRFSEGVLYVAVPDATWRQELSLQTDTIITKINSLVPGSAVSQLRLVACEKGR